MKSVFTDVLYLNGLMYWLEDADFRSKTFNSIIFHSHGLDGTAFVVGVIAGFFIKQATILQNFES